MGLRFVADNIARWNGQEIFGTASNVDSLFYHSQPCGNHSLAIRYPWLLYEHYNFSLPVSNSCTSEVLLSDQFSNLWE
jgi:hypothetical protein